MARTLEDRLERVEDALPPLARGQESISHTIDLVITPALRELGSLRTDVRTLQDQLLAYKASLKTLGLLAGAVVTFLTALSLVLSILAWRKGS